jgi:hypothetical protein
VNGTTAAIRIVRGNPTDEEIAAVVVVVHALAAEAARRAAEPGGSDTHRWGSPAERPTAQIRPGPGAWGRLALPPARLPPTAGR